MIQQRGLEPYGLKRATEISQEIYNFIFMKTKLTSFLMLTLALLSHHWAL